MNQHKVVPQAKKTVDYPPELGDIGCEPSPATDQTRTKVLLGKLSAAAESTHQMLRPFTLARQDKSMTV